MYVYVKAEAKLSTKMIIPGVAEWPSLGRLLDDVIGWLINLRKGAQFMFPSYSRQKLVT